MGLSERYPEDPNRLINGSWLTVSGINGFGAAANSIALRIAEEACRTAPDDWLCMIVLGAAQYRSGKDREAIETLTRASRFPGWVTRRGESSTLGFLGYQFRTGTRKGQNVPTLCFLVLAHARAGQLHEAQTALERLRELTKSLQIRPGSPVEKIVSCVTQCRRKASGLQPGS